MSALTTALATAVTGCTSGSSRARRRRGAVAAGHLCRRRRDRDGQRQGGGRKERRPRPRRRHRATGPGGRRLDEIQIHLVPVEHYSRSGSGVGCIDELVLSSLRSHTILSGSRRGTAFDDPHSPPRSSCSAEATSDSPRLGWRNTTPIRVGARNRGDNTPMGKKPHGSQPESSAHFTDAKWASNRHRRRC